MTVKNNLVRLIEKVKGIYIARPRIIRTEDGGEIVLKNASAETVAAVEAALKGTPTEDLVAEATPVTKASSGATLTSVALGMYQDALSLNWHVVTLKFSPSTKEAAVEKDSLIGRDRYEAVENFKIQAVGMGLVG